jgi:hypothetical protein
VALFFIDTSSGTVATQHQLIEAGIADAGGAVELPWFRIQGTGDATTLWYAVMRRREKGIFIGTLVLRHSDHHAFLLKRGWEEIPVAAIGPHVAGPAPDQPM